MTQLKQIYNFLYYLISKVYLVYADVYFEHVWDKSSIVGNQALYQTITTHVLYCVATHGLGFDTKLPVRQFVVSIRKVRLNFSPETTCIDASKTFP